MAENNHFNRAPLNLKFSGGNVELTVKNRQYTMSTDDFMAIREGHVPHGVAEVLNDLKISDKDMIDVALAMPLQEYHITISPTDRVSGHIRNGVEGLISYTVEIDKDGKPSSDQHNLFRFIGQIGPAYLIDGSLMGIGIELNGTKYGRLALDDAFTLLKEKYSITGTSMQRLREVLYAFTNNAAADGTAVQIRSSRVYVEHNTVKVDFSHVGDVKDILASLRQFREDASHPIAYTVTFAWALLAPLHESIKIYADVARRVQTPQLAMSGKTGGGKTPLGDFFIGKGFAMTKDVYFYSYQRVKTQFTMMKVLGMTNMPALFDDLPANYFTVHGEDLKAYVQTGHFGDRGRSDQTVAEYKGRRSFIGTVNTNIRTDDDLALSMRLIILRFTEANSRRKNIAAWTALLDALPDGFMFEIFRTMFEGNSILDITREAEKFQTPANWVNYILAKMNLLSQWYGLPEWPLYEPIELDDTDSNAMEVAEAFIAESNRILKNESEHYNSQTQQLETHVKYRSKIEGEFLVESVQDRTRIWFTGPAFKKLIFSEHLHLPYRNATEFLNNVNSDKGVKVENQGNSRTKKIYGQPYRCYCVSIPKIEEED